MRKILTVIAALLPAPAMAAELWCMPDQICIPGPCNNKIGADSAFRLTDPNGMHPSLRSHGETIAMKKTVEHRGNSQWDGVNAMGEHEKLTFNRDRMDFVYFVGKEAVRYKSSGLCEVQ